MYAKIRPHLPQFLRYLGSGGTAAALEIGSYQLMLIAGIWYQIAAPLSGFIGLLTAFLGHKYIVFQKKEETAQHAWRFIVLQLINLVIQSLLVIMFVEVFGVHELWAKILGIGCTVMWNFFLYKFFVYA